MESAGGCFHCGLPLPTGAGYSVIIDGSRRPLCCPGCQAVATAIVEGGLTDFYRYRTGPTQRAEDLVPEQLQSLELYDRPELQQSFVHREDEHVREAALIVEGIVCAACLWLTERHLCALPGVLEFRVNYTTHRARVRWDQRQIRLSAILRATAAIGYPAHPFDPGLQEALQKQERALALRRVAVAGIGAMQVMMLAVAMYFGDYYGMDDGIRHFMRWISLLIATPVLLYAARPFFSAAWRDLRRGGLGMDVPVAVAIAGAFSASAWHTWQGSGDVYFDSATMFTFFLLTGRFLEMNARHRAGRLSEELIRLLPATATRLNADDAEESVPATELKPGDRVLIRPGETIAADGRVQTGSSSVDESLLSGESNPIVKTPGETLMGGAVNVESPLVMVVEKVGADTLLSSIVRLLDRAQAEKPGIAMLADRVASVFVAAVLLIAAGVAWWWWRHDPDAAFTITLSVLVVTCPCALSLATPTAITVATSCLTRLGLLTTRGHALETLARADHVVFDKTGTLTHGRLRLLAIHPVRDTPPLPVLELAAALERGSEHPVGRALVEAASGALRATSLQNTPGRGTQGLIQGIPYRLGTGEFVTALSQTPAEFPRGASPATWVALGDEKGLLAWFELADQLRPDAAATVRVLQTLGLKVLLLSGDRPETVAAVARLIALPQAEGGLLPQDKLDRIKDLQRQGAVVAMVGDGINDAPVLARAQVSIAMGEGTQLAHASADMILLSEQLSRFADGIKIARRTLAVIRQNLAWAIAYNMVALPLAAAGWVAPWMAALGMSLSSLLVVANALRLKQGPPAPGMP
jgi:Cu2+-exporting ATPase